MGSSCSYKFLLILLYLVFFNIHILSQSDWERLENLNGGKFRVILIADDQSIYTGGESSGLYKFNSGNNTWELINDSLRYSYSIIFLIGQDFDNNIYITSGGGYGLIRSTDKGLTWSNTQLTRSVFCFKRDTVNKLLLVGSTQVIYESSDNGLNWIADTVTAAPESIMSIDVNDEGTIYAGTSDGLFKKEINSHYWTRLITPDQSSIFRYVKVHNNDIYINIRGNIYKSVDGGENWDNIFGITASPSLIGIEFDVDNNIYILYDQYGMFKSTNNGQTFFGLNFPTTSKNFFTYDSKKNYLYVCTDQDIYISSDGGQNWYAQNRGLFNLRITDLCTGKFDYLFAASFYNDSYIYISKDYGRNWIQSNLQLHWYSGRIASDNSGNVYVVKENSLYKYNYERNEFKSVSYVYYAYSVSTDSYGSVFVCYDYPGKLLWIKKGNLGDKTILPVPGEYVKFAAEDSKGNLFAVREVADSYSSTTTECYKYNFENETWTLLVSLEHTRLNDFDIDSSDNLYMSCSNFNGIMKSTNSGKTWYEIGSEGYDLFIDSLEQMYAATYYGVYKSTDRGEHWRTLNHWYYNRFIALTKTKRGNLFVSNDFDGVYRYLGEASYPVKIKDFYFFSQNKYVTITWITEDDQRNAGFFLERSADSTNWEQRGFIAGNSSDTAISKLYFIEDTLNQGESFYYRLKQVSTDSLTSYSRLLRVDYTFVAENFSYNLYHNYPNPFNPNTKIKYSIPHTSQVQIKVFDILGNEIETLINEEKPAGIYELTWNAASFPSGVYFYQLRATPVGGQAEDSPKGSEQVFVETKKMLLLK